LRDIFLLKSNQIAKHTTFTMNESRSMKTTVSTLNLPFYSKPIHA